MKYNIHYQLLSPSKIKIPKSTQNFYETLKKNINNKYYIDKIMKKDEITNVISNILLKEERTLPELFIIKTYLSQLKKFMDILNPNESQISIDAILLKISRELQLEKFQENTFLMKIGEKGKNFYVTLSGSVIILIPKEFEITMNREEYINHLKLLYNNNESYLMNKIISANKSIFPIDKEEYEISDSNYEMNNYSIDKYLSKINYEEIENKEEEKEKILLTSQKKNLNYLFKKFQIKCYGYINIVELGHGSIFGETALINENNKRTASIFVKTNSVFGTLTSNAFKDLMKVFLEKSKKGKISFIFNTPLFKNLYITEIVKLFWNYFVEKKMKKGEYLFKVNEERKEIYFIQKGSFKLIFPQFSLTKANFIISEIKNLYNDDNSNFSSETKDIIISTINYGEILGMDDCIIKDNIYFLNALCETDNTVYFSINIKVIHSILDKYQEIKENWKLLCDKKINFMLERLNNIKRYFINSIERKVKLNSSKNNLSRIENCFNHNEKNDTRNKKLKTIYVGHLDLKKIKSKIKKENEILTIRTNNLLTKRKSSKGINEGNTPIKKIFPKITLNKIKINEKLNSFNLTENSFEKNNTLLNKKSLYKLCRFKENKSEEKNNITKFPEFGSPYFKKLLEKDDITKILFKKKLSKKIEKNNNFFSFKSLSNYDKKDILTSSTNNIFYIKPKGKEFEKKFNKNILSSFRIPRKFKEKYLKNLQ